MGVSVGVCVCVCVETGLAQPRKLPTREQRTNTTSYLPLEDCTLTTQQPPSRYSTHLNSPSDYT